MSGDIGISDVKIDYDKTDANEEKINYAIGYAVRAKSEGKDKAGYIREAFDKKYGGSWHCFAGQEYTFIHEYNSDTKIKLTLGDSKINLFQHRTSSEPKASPRTYPHISPSDRRKIKDSEMDTEMEYHAFDCCKRAYEWYSSNTERVTYIAEEFDKEHNRGWNCVIGVGFGHAVHYQHKCYNLLDNFGKENAQIVLFRC